MKPSTDSRHSAAAFTLAVLLLVSMTPQSHAQENIGSIESRIGAALEAYRSGQDAQERELRVRHFSKSARLFFSLAEENTANAALWRNAANAALQAHDLGHAILAYRRVLSIAPGDPQAMQNIDHARSLLPAWLPRPEEAHVLDSFFFWHRHMSRESRTTAAAAAFLTASLLIGIGIATGLRGLLVLSWLPGLVWIAMMGSLLAQSPQAQSAQAVIVVDETVARAADSRNAESRFSSPLPAGAEVRVVEERAGFTRIQLANGRDAWVPASSLERVEGARG